MDKYLEQRIAAELRAELARQGHSRHWLAEQIGKPVTTVARWLRGPQSPGLNDLDAMCQALDMSIADLLVAVEKNGGYGRVPLPAGRGAAAAGGGSRKVDNRRDAGRDTHQNVSAFAELAAA
jgi:transcriptional regulator with XRE-family HTH domain